MPNDSGVKWLGLGNWVNQVSGYFPQYNDPKWNLIHSVGKHQLSLIFIVIRHLLFFEHSANTSDDKEVEWARNREVPFAEVTFHRSQLQVSDSLIGNDKPNKSPSIKNNILVKD